MPSASPRPATVAAAKQKQLESFSQGPENLLTTNQGVVIPDNHNSLKAGVRGPTLLEDFILREKITHFDHERIPERVVHARGAGAHGYFELTRSMVEYTRADFLQEVGSAHAGVRALLHRGRLARLGRHRARRARASRSSSIRAKATTTWWATTSRCSSCRTR